MLIEWMKRNTLLSALLKVQIRGWRKESRAVNPGALEGLRCDERRMKRCQK